MFDWIFFHKAETFTSYRPGMKGWMVERASVVELNHGKVEIIGAEVQGGK